MKVITIRQPYASLIMNGYKEFEFRVWSTKYRGPIFIHAGKSVDKKALAKFSSLSLNYPTGCILGKAILSDCVFITEELASELRKKDEAIYGNALGCYGFRLENVEKIPPIFVKGNLSLWNYYTPLEIMDKMTSITYGYMDKFGLVHKSIDKEMEDIYVLQSPQEVIKNKVGLCWDQVELERYYFQGHLHVKTFFIEYLNKGHYETHTFLTFQENGKWFWFEHAWEKGIFSYDNFDDLIEDIQMKLGVEKMAVYEYRKPKSHLSSRDFIRFCKEGFKDGRS